MSRIASRLWLAPLLLLAGAPAAAEPDAAGQTGLVTLPDARMAHEGVLDVGLTYSGPETGLFATIAALPRLEATFQFVRLEGVPIGVPGAGGYRDKLFHLKFIALEENGWRPAIALGATDVHGTQIYPSQYLVASKRLDSLDLTLGYGSGRIDGVFGGARWRPDWAAGFGLVVEHDAHDYSQDRIGAALVSPDRAGGPVAALEYDGRWWGIAVTVEDGELGGRAHLRFDFDKPDWAPKSGEPLPLTRATTPPPPTPVWHAERAPALALAERLYAQDFDDVDVALDGTTLLLRLSNNRISQIGRAVGRAARTALLHGPPETRALRITYTQLDLPLATYSFTDLGVLRAYFAGEASAEALAPTVQVSYASAADATRLTDHALLLADQPAPELGDPEYALNLGRNASGQWLAFERHQRNSSTFQLKPLIVQGYFNDLDGAFRYDLFAGLFYTRELGAGLRFAATARVTLANDIDQASGFNSSALPHVRSDIALYKEATPAKFENLYLARYAQWGERLYARLSAGLYEEMFAGAGGQLLYLPKVGDWATDLSVEYARQRDYDGGGFLDYDTVTALVALHYRVPAHGLTLTARAGRFLARDSGVRFEVSRRFRSGFDCGLWYTLTDGNDTTGPGTPGSPYHDKGVFLSIPLSLTLPYDSQARGSFSLAPWSRDVGAMIRFPVDLYPLVSDTLLLNTTDANPLSRFGQ